MQIRDIMTQNVRYLPPSTSLQEAAKCMKELDCGFLPIGDDQQDRLMGVVTDRDITIRAVAEGFSPSGTTIDEIKTNRVLYCFQDDDVEDVVENMRLEQLYRLVVLNNPREKRLCGVVSLGDVMRHHGASVNLVGKAAEGITSKQAA